MLTALPQGHILRHPEGEKGGGLPESYQQVQKFIPQARAGAQFSNGHPTLGQKSKRR